MADNAAQTTESTNASIGFQAFGELLSAIARKSPAPGGGAVASAAGSLAASLAGMVLAYSRGKKSLAKHAEAHEMLADRCATASCKLLELADADAAAYAQLNALQRLDEGDPQRTANLADAAQRCVDVPLDVQRVCLSLLEGFEELAPIANQWLLSDLKIAAILAEAAVRASDCNVEVNAPTLGKAVSPEAERDAQATSLGAVERAKGLLHSIEALIDD
ncbi:MAG: cyclodeaminase/cyclohydrolase family protein [Phycisphaera sp.]|nr:MAG: cyclodeaminase/cyclohydrolase family protein [Phycisphaera sp.]